MFTCQNRKNPVYHRCIRILPTSSELEGPSPDQRRSWQLPNHRAPWLFQARGALLTPLDDQKSSQAQSSKTNIIFKALDGSYEETGRSETLLSRTSWPFPFYWFKPESNLRGSLATTLRWIRACFLDLGQAAKEWPKTLQARREGPNNIQPSK